MPQWVQRGGWTPVPNTFFSHVMRACSQFEQAILATILFRTAGDSQRGRPEWVRLSEEQLAKQLDGHVNGISRAIGRLEEMGAIEARQVGRAKEYRAIVEAWDKLTPRAPRKIEKRAEPEDESASLLETADIAAMAAPPQVLVILPGVKGKHPLREVCPGGAHCELVQLYEANKTGKNATLECGDSTEKAKTRGRNTTLECGDRSPVLRSVPNPPPSPPPTLLDGEFSEFYALIDSLLSTRLLQPPPMAILETQFERMKAHDVPIDYVEARVRLRIEAFRSYGLLEHVVTDCIKAVDAARENQRQAEAGQAFGANAPDAAAVRTHLERCAAQIPAGAAWEELRSALAAAADDAERHAADLTHAEMHLANVEAMARNLAEAELTPEARSAIEGDVERQVCPYRERMNHDEFSSLRAEIYMRRLFEQARLPRLSLFYAERS